MSAATWDALDEDLTDVDEAELHGDDPDPTLPDRMLRAVARHRRKVTEAAAIVAAEKERLDDWLAHRRSVHDTTFLEDALAGYHEARLARDPKLRTIALPSGSLRFRKSPDRVDVETDTFLAAQGEGSPLVRVKREPDKPALLKHVKATGELPPGVQVVPGEDRFSVETAEDLQ